MPRLNRAPALPLHPSVHRELVDLLYTALPQVGAIALTALTGAVALAMVSGDQGYAVIAVLILLTAALRISGLLRYPRGSPLTPVEVLRWERAYGLRSSAFGLALGLLSYRALELGDAPGAWISFGLAMSFCVGMVSRAAVRPWIVLLTAAMLLAPVALGGLMRPELPYKLGAAMLLLFWVTLREASRHLSTAFIDRLEAKLALAHQASHDVLTGLPNRAAFLAALETVDTPHAVIALDLDGFKPVNDRLGHHAGDALLRQVAERLRDCMGGQGIVARMGGDEFMLLLPFQAGEPDVGAAQNLARHAVTVLGKPFDLGEAVTIGASAGIALAGPGEAESGSLLERVDVALYAAKRDGGGRWCWSGAVPVLDGCHAG